MNEKQGFTPEEIQQDRQRRRDDDARREAIHIARGKLSRDDLDGISIIECAYCFQPFRVITELEAEFGICEECRLRD